MGKSDLPFLAIISGLRLPSLSKLVVGVSNSCGGNGPPFIT